MKLGDRIVGAGAPPFVIAELSGNHNQSLDRALDIVEAAAASGAHALKLQTYTPGTMTLDVRDGDFFISNQASPWYGQSLYELYEVAHTPWDWHEPLMQRAAELGIICFSTPFDESAVDYLESLEVPAYKIASFENCDLPLIERVASTGKPLIISTGMATIAEIDDAVKAARRGGCQELVLLKCTSTYPASPASSNVTTIPHMAELFRCDVGLSDHTLGLGASVAAVALGATVIEKHFTLDRSDGGVDAAFSLEPSEMRHLVDETKRAWQSLGRITYGADHSESSSMIFRRSIYVSDDMKAGDVISTSNIRRVRPGYGLAPKHFHILLGRRINQDVRKGTAMRWDLIG
jgi:pseudaminic acid synthase